MPSTNGSPFGEWLFALRKQQGEAQRRLAERFYATAPLVGRYERGEIAPSIEVAPELTEALGTTLCDEKVWRVYAA